MQYTYPTNGPYMLPPMPYHATRTPGDLMECPICYTLNTGDDQDGWCDDCLAAWDDHTAEEYDRFVNEWEHFCNA